MLDEKLVETTAVEVAVEDSDPGQEPAALATVQKQEGNE